MAVAAGQMAWGLYAGSKGYSSAPNGGLTMVQENLQWATNYLSLAQGNNSGYVVQVRSRHMLRCLHVVLCTCHVACRELMGDIREYAEQKGATTCYACACSMAVLGADDGLDKAVIGAASRMQLEHAAMNISADLNTISNAGPNMLPSSGLLLSNL